MFYINLKYLLCALIVIPAGIASRKWAHYLPDFIAAYAGDMLWAMLVYFLARTFITTIKVAVVTALVFSFAIEFLQLYHARWIDHLRDTVPGALILGYGFLWTDLVCYAAGIIIGSAVDRAWLESGD